MRRFEAGAPTFEAVAAPEDAPSQPLELAVRELSEPVPPEHPKSSAAETQANKHRTKRLMATLRPALTPEALRA
jgi:hypothetical protein